MQEEIDGYRRTSVKTRHKHILREKLQQFEANGEKTKVFTSGPYHYIYIKKEKNLDGGKKEEQTNIGTESGEKDEIREDD